MMEIRIRIFFVTCIAVALQICASCRRVQHATSPRSNNGESSLTNHLYVAYRFTSQSGALQYVGDVFFTNSAASSIGLSVDSHGIRRVKTIRFHDATFENVVTEAIPFKFSPTNFVYDIDVETITKLHFGEKYVTNASGLEALSALQSLFCHANNLTRLDVSHNTNLIKLLCRDNPELRNLDVSHNSRLQYLSCGGKTFEELNVSNCTNLTVLYCAGRLKNLDLSDCVNLTDLACTGTDLISLDVSRNTKLRSLAFDLNDLATTLDVSHNTNLTHLSCGANNLQALDISRNTKLTHLSCADNCLRALDVSKNPNLTVLQCQGNQLRTLDISSNTNIIHVNATGNPLAEIVGWWNPPSNVPSSVLLEIGVRTLE